VIWGEAYIKKREKKKKDILDQIILKACAIYVTKA
jgi:hypothetical protein